MLAAGVVGGGNSVAWAEDAPTVAKQLLAHDKVKVNDNYALKTYVEVKWFKVSAITDPTKYAKDKEFSFPDGEDGAYSPQAGAAYLGEVNNGLSTPSGSAVTGPGAADAAIRVKITKAATKNDLGEVTLVGATVFPGLGKDAVLSNGVLNTTYKGYAIGGFADLTLPEFVWHKTSAANASRDNLLVYKVTAIDKDFFNNIYVADYNEPTTRLAATELYVTHLNLPPSVPVLPETLPAIGASKSGGQFKVNIQPTWNKTYYVVSGTTEPAGYGYDSPGFNEGSLYFDKSVYAEGASVVANVLNFTSPTKDRRTQTLSKETLVNLATALGKATKVTSGTTPYPVPTSGGVAELTLGTYVKAAFTKYMWAASPAGSWWPTDVYSGDQYASNAEGETYFGNIDKYGVLTLGVGALGEPALLDFFSSIKIGPNVGGSLAEAGIAKLRAIDAKGDAKATTLTLDLTLATLKSAKASAQLPAGAKATLDVSGDKLFAAVEKTAANGDPDGYVDFKLTLYLPGHTPIAGFPRTTISAFGKEYFAGTQVEIGAFPGTPGAFLSDITVIPSGAFADAVVSFANPTGTDVVHTIITQENSAASGNSSPVFTNVETVEAGAFKGASVTSPPVSTTNNTAVTYFALQLPAVKEIEASAFEGLKTPIAKLSSIAEVESIGESAFKGVTFASTETSAETVSTGALVLPFTEVKSIGAGAFAETKQAGSGEATATTKVVIGAAGGGSAINTEELSIAADAFGSAEVLVPLAALTAWQEELAVTPVTTPTTSETVAKLIDKNAKEISDWKLSFADVKTKDYRVVFDQTKGYSLYTISGPATAGFTTEEGELIDLEEALSAEQYGIDLKGLPLVAAYYTVQLYKNYGDTKPLTYLLEIEATNLNEEGFKADTLFIDYSGDALAKVLGTYDSTVFKLVENPGVDPEKKYFDLSSVKLNKLTAIENYTALAALAEGATFGVIEPWEISFAGNSKGKFGIPVAVKQVSIDTAVVNVPNVGFKIAEKSYSLNGKEVTLAGADTNGVKAEYKVKIYETAPTDQNAWLTVVYTKSTKQEDIDKAKAPTSIGTHDITLTGHGYLTGTYVGTFDVQAAWSDIAVVTTSDFGLNKEYTYNGAVQVKDFAKLVKTTSLAAADYIVFALPSTVTLAQAEISDAILDNLSAAGEYNFYIGPDGQYKEAYELTDAVPAGWVKIEKLEATKLQAAAVLSVAEAAEAEDEDSEAAAPVKYDVSFGTVYVGAVDSVATGEKDIKVYFSDAVAKSIDGLTVKNKLNYLSLGLPSGDPDALELEPLPENENVWNFAVEGGSLDLWKTFKAVKASGSPDLDWKTRITFLVSDLDAKHFSIDGGILTSVDEWNGTVTVVYTSADGKKELKQKVAVTAYTDTPPPTSIEAVVAGDASAVYYTLGGVAVQGVPSKAGLYIVKSGDKVVKVLKK
jgi:hypothetical protein